MGLLGTSNKNLAQQITAQGQSDFKVMNNLLTLQENHVEDEHVEDSVCFGYKGCGLPLVLDHNTPNNSVALLWAQSGDNVGVNHTMKPLFARRKRHSSDG